VEALPCFMESKIEFINNSVDMEKNYISISIGKENTLLG
jgi:hypothetical protein